MKKFRKILLVVIVGTLLLSLFSFIYADVEKYGQKNTFYNYPITPDMAEWELFTSGAEMATACEIPEEILSELSTEDVLQLILEYPMLPCVAAYDDIQKGFEMVMGSFNGTKELFQRKDAVNVLIKTYDNFNLENNQNIVYGINRGGYMLDVLELLLCQNEILEKCTIQQIDKISEIAIDKQIMKEQSSVYAGRLAKTNILSYESLVSGYRTAVQTPRGTDVMVYCGPEQLSEEDMINMFYQMRELFPNAMHIGGATSCFNCHSYAWYSISPDNPYWMDDPSPYWEDGSYVLTGTYEFGDKLVYFEGSSPIHSAYITVSGSGIPSEVASKWGSYGVYRHAPGYGPYYSATSYSKYTLNS